MTHSDIASTIILYMLVALDGVLALALIVMITTEAIKHWRE